MKVHCVSCAYEINLDHKVFDYYSGPIKCYCCGSMMVLKSKQGVMCSLRPSEESAGMGVVKRGSIPLSSQ